MVLEIKIFINFHNLVLLKQVHALNQNLSTLRTMHTEQYRIKKKKR